MMACQDLDATRASRCTWVPVNGITGSLYQVVWIDEGRHASSVAVPLQVRMGWATATRGGGRPGSPLFQGPLESCYFMIMKNR